MRSFGSGSSSGARWYCAHPLPILHFQTDLVYAFLNVERGDAGKEAKAVAREEKSHNGSSAHPRSPDLSVSPSMGPSFHKAGSFGSMGSPPMMSPPSVYGNSASSIHTAGSYGKLAKKASFDNVPTMGDPSYGPSHNNMPDSWHGAPPPNAMASPGSWASASGVQGIGPAQTEEERSGARSSGLVWQARLLRTCREFVYPGYFESVGRVGTGQCILSEGTSLRNCMNIDPHTVAHSTVIS